MSAPARLNATAVQHMASAQDVTLDSAGAAHVAQAVNGWLAALDARARALSFECEPATFERERSKAP